MAHASDVKDFARGLVERLRTAGCKPFFDERDLKAGDPYNPFLEDAAKSCSLFIFIVSARSVEPGAYSLTKKGVRLHFVLA